MTDSPAPPQGSLVTALPVSQPSALAQSEPPRNPRGKAKSSHQRTKSIDGAPSTLPAPSAAATATTTTTEGAVTGDQKLKNAPAIVAPQQPGEKTIEGESSVQTVMVAAAADRGKEKTGEGPKEQAPQICPLTGREKFRVDLSLPAGWVIDEASEERYYNVIALGRTRERPDTKPVFVTVVENGMPSRQSIVSCYQEIGRQLLRFTAASETAGLESMSTRNRYADEPDPLCRAVMVLMRRIVTSSRAWTRKAFSSVPKPVAPREWHHAFGLEGEHARVIRDFCQSEVEIALRMVGTTTSAMREGKPDPIPSELRESAEQIWMRVYELRLLEKLVEGVKVAWITFGKTAPRFLASSWPAGWAPHRVCFYREPADKSLPHWILFPGAILQENGMMLHPSFVIQ